MNGIHKDAVEKKGRGDPKTDEVDGYLRTCLSAVESPATAKLVESFAQQWDKRGWLSPKQVAVLKKIHDEL